MTACNIVDGAAVLVELFVSISFNERRVRWPTIPERSSMTVVGPDYFHVDSDVFEISLSYVVERFISCPRLDGDLEKIQYSNSGHLIAGTRRRIVAIQFGCAQVKCQGWSLFADQDCQSLNSCFLDSAMGFSTTGRKYCL